MGANNTILYQPEEGLDDVSYAFRIFLIVFQSILCLVGGFGNVLTIIAVLACKKLRRTHNAYVAHLAFVDFVISALLIPTNIYGLYHDKSADDSIGCKAIAVISLAALVSSTLSLFMVALNRYILICKGAYTYTRLYNWKTVPLTIMLLWIWAFAVVLPLLSFGGLGWSIKTHYCFFVNYDFTTYMYINLGLAQGGVVVPAAGTSICYMLIIRKLRATARKLAPKAPTSSTVKDPAINNFSSGSGGSNNTTSTVEETLRPSEMSSAGDDEDDFGEHEHLETKLNNGNNNGLPTAGKYTKAISNEQLKRQRAKQRQHNRRIMGLIAIFTVFMLCWLPIAFTFTIDYKQQLPGIVYVTLISVAWVNSCINVFLYAFTNQTYRHAFRCILTCNWSRINSQF